MDTASASPLGRAERFPRIESTGRTLVMGVLNVTPDSFFGGSRVSGVRRALRRAAEMEEEGADLIDVGGESTRPGARPVSEREETERVLPVIEALAGKLSVPISVDTSKAAVAERALGAGAKILNDITALRADARMAGVALRYPRVLFMHMRGDPRTMQRAPRYRDVVAEILEFFRRRLRAFSDAGGDVRRVWLDPGIGFGKTVEHNLEILRRLKEFARLSRPVLVGASRKSFIGRLLGSDKEPLAPEERLEGSLAVACRAAAAGVFAVRVHDVAATRRALEVFRRVS